MIDLKYGSVDNCTNMVNYQNGKVYKLVAGGMTYVGSTTLPLSRRKEGHKTGWKQWKAGKKRKTSSYDLFESGEPVDIVLLEDVPCERREQLHARERHWIETLDCVNLRVPGRTMKEYREANRDKILEGKKRYLEANRDKIKEYYEANRDKMREYKKQHYEANRDKIKEYQKQRVPCPECGKEMRKDSITRHIRMVHK